MNAFEAAWSLLKTTTCPLCHEEGSGEWFFNHYEECGKNHIEQNSPNLDLGENKQKTSYNLALDKIKELGMPMEDLRPMVDEMPDTVENYSGFKGIDSQTSDRLWEAQENAMIDSMYQNGTLGRHPDQQVVQDDTTRRVSLWMANEDGLANERKRWVQDRFDSSDLDARGFGESMAELLHGGSVHEELQENDRTWDDVDWHSIIDDEHQAQISEFYDGIASGEYEVDEDGELDDWIYRDHHIDDDEHEKRIQEARSSRVGARINRLVHDSLTEEQRYAPGFSDVFNQAWDKMVLEDLQMPENRENFGIDDINFESYMNTGWKRRRGALDDRL